MGWETRERGTGSYYYRSKRVGGRVRKEYQGHGRLGQLAAKLDKIERQEKAEEAAFWKQERERLKREAGFLLELEGAAKILTTAQLLAVGCHKYKGEWRRLRESA